jgi:micrococcal nuclease
MNADEFPLYRYRTKDARAVDGDTIRATVDLGFGVTTTLDLRLAGIEAPETRGETKQAGELAKQYLDALIAHGTLLVRTQKDRRSFARYVADVWREDDGKDVAELLVDAGHAEWVR